MFDALVKELNLNTKHTIRENNKKEGIEIYFTSIPSGLERQALKDNKWRWSSFNKCWYIKKSDLGIEIGEKKQEKIKEEVKDLFKEETKTRVKVAKQKVANIKQELATIKKILKYNEKIKPILSAYTPLEDNKVAFTDSYRLCVLNRESLPFNVAFMEDYKDKKEYMKKYGSEETKMIDGNYPNLTKIMQLGDTDETYTFNAEEVKEKAKASGKKNKNERLMQFTTNKGNKIMIDSEYLKDMITLLQIKDKEITMNYYGEIKPTTYENENGFYLALPIKTY